MIKDTVSVIVIFVGIIIFLGAVFMTYSSIAELNERRTECEARGGVYIENYCLKVEILK